jgi:hypothetical protein
MPLSCGHSYEILRLVVDGQHDACRISADRHVLSWRNTSVERMVCGSGAEGCIKWTKARTQYDGATSPIPPNAGSVAERGGIEVIDQRSGTP